MIRKEIDIMFPVKIKLWDSVSLSVINTDKFKTAMIFFSFRLPRDRAIAAPKLALPGILRRGTKEYPSAARLNLELDKLYAATVEIKLSHLGKNDLLTFAADMLDNSFIPDGTDVLDGVIKLISEMVLHPITENGTFPAETVEKEKSNVLDALKAEANNPRTYTASRCAELLHDGDPDFAPLSELISEISEADEHSVFDVYQKLLSSAALDIFYVGAEDPTKVEASLRAHFSDFAPKALPSSVPTAEKFSAVKDVKEPFPVSQSKLSLGFRLGVCPADKDYYAAILFNEILGGSPASKLFMNVRERLSLCYYCSSHYDPYFGNLTVSSGVDNENAETAKAEILAQIEDMKNGRISDVEFNAAKRAFEHYCRQIYDYPFDIFAFYRSRAVLGVDTTIEQHAKRISEVTLDDVVAVAQKIMLDTVYLLEGTLDGDEEVGDDE